VISGNCWRDPLQNGATGNTIQGMRSDTQSGSSDIGNGTSGVQVVDSGENKIGGTDPGAGNVITGNNGNGILIAGANKPGAGNVSRGT